MNRVIMNSHIPNEKGREEKKYPKSMYIWPLCVFVGQSIITWQGGRSWQRIG